MDTAILESFAIVISSCDLFAMTTVAKLSSKLWNKWNVIGRYFKEFISMESTNWLLEYSSCYHLPVTHQPIFSSSNGAVVQPMLFSISECCSMWYKKLYESVLYTLFSPCSNRTCYVFFPWTEVRMTAYISLHPFPCLSCSASLLPAVRDFFFLIDDKNAVLKSHRPALPAHSSVSHFT